MTVTIVVITAIVVTSAVISVTWWLVGPRTKPKASAPRREDDWQASSERAALEEMMKQLRAELTELRQASELQAAEVQRVIERGDEIEALRGVMLRLRLDLREVRGASAMQQAELQRIRFELQEAGRSSAMLEAHTRRRMGASGKRLRLVEGKVTAGLAALEDEAMVARGT